MDRSRPIMGWLCVVVISLALGMAPPYAGAADSSKKGRAAKNAVPRLSLPEAVNISLTRNLRMADSRLAVQEKEHQRREAFSDFFPTLDVQYISGLGSVQTEFERGGLCRLARQRGGLCEPCRRGHPLLSLPDRPLPDVHLHCDHYSAAVHGREAPQRLQIRADWGSTIPRYSFRLTGRI